MVKHLTVVQIHCIWDVCVLCRLHVILNVSSVHPSCTSFICDARLHLGSFGVFEGRMCATITSVNTHSFSFTPTPNCPILLLSCSVVVEICGSVLFLSV